jgi:hypothetical protein
MVHLTLLSERCGHSNGFFQAFRALLHPLVFAGAMRLWFKDRRETGPDLQSV